MKKALIFVVSLSAIALTGFSADADSLDLTVIIRQPAPTVVRKVCNTYTCWYENVARQPSRVVTDETYYNRHTDTTYGDE